MDSFTDRPIKQIKIPSNKKDDLILRLSWTGLNKGFVLTRGRIDILDQLKPEGWWRSYIPAIMNETRLFKPAPRNIKQFKAIGLKINEDNIVW